MGVGVIVKDDMGRIKAVMSKKIPIPWGAVEAEVMAYETGLLFAKDIGIHDFIMEGDSLIIHRAMCDMSTPPSSVAAVIQGMQDMCKEFRRFMFSHVKRKGNKPAHLLAKHASGVDDFITWVEETPCFIEQALLDDVTNVSFINKILVFL